MGGIFSIGYSITHILRYIYLIKGCYISTILYAFFEEGTYALIDILRVISYMIFLWDTGGYFNYSSTTRTITWDKRISLVLVLVTSGLVSLVALPAAFVGHKRDMIYIGKCPSNKTYEETLNMSIVISHTTCKYFVLFSTVIVSLSATLILQSSKSKWEGVPECASTWNGKEEDLKKLVNRKFYRLYNHYIAIGRATESDRKAIRQWFVFMYFIYFVFVLVRMVHVMKILQESPHTHPAHYWDLAHAIFNIVLNFFGFLLPFFMASWLNTAHQKHYRKICDAYMEVELVAGTGINDCTVSQSLGSGGGGSRYVCRPGNDIRCTYLAATQPSGASSDDELTPLLRQPEINRQEVEEKYMLYYNLARSNPMVKMADFDFVPSFLNIRIPLDSQGYTFAIVLSVVSAVFKYL